MGYNQIYNEQSDDISNILAERIPAESICEVCGPVVCTLQGISVTKAEDLIRAGMRVCRLNFSHGSFETHGDTVLKVREANRRFPGTKVAIMLDTKGPEIRTGNLSEPKIHLKKGNTVVITSDYTFVGDVNKFALSYPNLCKSLVKGNTILIADGSLVLKVKSIDSDTELTAEICNDASIGSYKNCNLPGVKVDLPCISEKDKKDIVEFGLVHSVDIIAVSFVQSASDISSLRSMLLSQGLKDPRDIMLMSKIENEEGVRNYKEIIKESDALMIARGDMGMEIPNEKVPAIQKLMIANCMTNARWCVVATQMLESMITNPRPTRAEATDVWMAHALGTDATMLSGESANGSFPVECVTFMKKCAREVLAVQAPYHLTKLVLNALEEHSDTKNIKAAIEAAQICMDPANEIGLVISIDTPESHYEYARSFSRLRLPLTIIGVVRHEKAANQLTLSKNMIPYHSPDSPKDEDLVKLFAGKCDSLRRNVLIFPSNKIVKL